LANNKQTDDGDGAASGAMRRKSWLIYRKVRHLAFAINHASLHRSTYLIFWSTSPGLVVVGNYWKIIKDGVAKVARVVTGCDLHV
jgi:hypothetical protein